MLNINYFFKKILLSIFINLSFLFIFSYQSYAWWNNDYQYRFKYTINNSEINSTLTDFTFLIDLKNDAPANFWSHVDSTGKDIRVIDNNDITDLTSQSHLEQWSKVNTTGIIWIKKTIAQSGNTDYVWIYYGNSTAVNLFSDTTKAETYDDNYLSVWHLDENSGSGAYLKDATVNNFDGTPQGSTSLSSGKIGIARTFDGLDDYITITDSATLDIISGFTYSLWLNPDSTDTIGLFTKFADDNGYHTYLSNGTIYSDWKIGGSWLTTTTNGFNSDNWHQYATTYDGNEVKTYIDSTLIDTKSASGTLDNTIDLDFGRHNTAGMFIGSLDEIRISDISRSEEWLEFSYTSDTGNAGSSGNEEDRGYLITNLPEGLNSYLTSDWTTDVTTNFQTGIKNIGIKNNDYRIASINIGFLYALDWSDLTTDSNGSKSFFHYPGGFSSIPGASGVGYTLYVPKGLSYKVAICPGASSLDQVNSSCEDRYYLDENDNNLELVSEDGIYYWKISDLTSSGGEGVDPFLTFSIESIGANTLTNGITTTIASQINNLDFGFLEVGEPEYMAHKLNIAANSTNGYSVKIKLNSFMQGNKPENIINEFPTDWSSPIPWSTPSGNSPSVNTGWIGVNTSDTRVPNWSNAEGKFGPLGTTYTTIMYSEDSDEDGSSAYITYAIEVNQYQPTDVYLGSIIYNVLPNY